VFFFFKEYNRFISKNPVNDVLQSHVLGVNIVNMFCSFDFFKMINYTEHQ